ncbi:MAG: hypothetical protein AABY22_13505 [Nanoarchaeota archaeon]
MKKRIKNWVCRIANDWSFGNGYLDVQLFSIHYSIGLVFWITFLGFTIIIEKE